MKWSYTFGIFALIISVSALFTPDTRLERASAVLALVKFSYLTAFAATFGTSIWVSFIGGIIMFKNLPRHQFGNLQSKLFPAYFSLVAVCSAISLAGFSFLRPWRHASSSDKLEAVSLATTLFSSLLNLVVLEPLTSSAMKHRHKVEKEIGIGSEIGGAKNREMAATNDALHRANKRFGVLHGLSSLANLVSLGGVGVHLWYLSQKINI